MGANKTPERHGGGRSSRFWYRVLLVLVPSLIPFFWYLVSSRRGSEKWSTGDLAIAAALFVGYWGVVLFVAVRAMRSRSSIQSLNLASPLIEVPLPPEARDRLVYFATTRQQKLAVVAFELLDREIPRFEQEDDRHRAIRDNEQLRQQAGQGAFLVAVTTEILRRLLLLSGVREDERHLWRSQISETAARIVSDALDHQLPAIASH